MLKASTMCSSDVTIYKNNFSVCFWWKNIQIWYRLGIFTLKKGANKLSSLKMDTKVSCEKVEIIIRENWQIVFIFRIIFSHFFYSIMSVLEDNNIMKKQTLCKHILYRVTTILQRESHKNKLLFLYIDTL